MTEQFTNRTIWVRGPLARIVPEPIGWQISVLSFGLHLMTEQFTNSTIWVRGPLARIVPEPNLSHLCPIAG